MKHIVPNAKQIQSHNLKISKPKKEEGNKSSAVVINVASAFGPEISKLKYINFKVILKCTNEQFTVKKFPISFKVRELKGFLEFVCGIPYNLQRLSYLDDGELIDPKELTYYDVIEGAVIIMDIWTIYLDLVKAVVSCEIDLVLHQGVSKSIDWTSPAADYMFTKDKANYITERSGIALFISAHRGYLNLAKTLLAHGADINYKSSFGRTPIQISVVADQMKMIDFFLENNADVDLSDMNGDNPVLTAKKFNNKLAQHRLAQFKWKKRLEEESKSKKEVKEQKEVPAFLSDDRLPHQVYDSSKKTWLKGEFMQMYMAQLVNQGEYSGSSLSAPKSIGLEVKKKHLNKSNSELNKSLRASSQEKDEEDRPNISLERGASFDVWLEHKKKREMEVIKKKKSAEALLRMQLENANDYIREVSAVVDSESNKSQWMNNKSNVNTNSKLVSSDPSNNKKGSSTLRFNEERPSRSNSGKSSKKKLENIIYKGMPYEEWGKVRDQFLKNHNMI